MKIVIKDFEIIKDLSLDVEPGLTIISGDSNNGKSSIFKAIRACLYNSHSDLKIRKGTKSYTVAVQDGAHSVVCQRNGSKQIKTLYKVDGNVLSKVGRNEVPEVAQALRIAPIDMSRDKVHLNFIKQFAFPFLLDKTPGQLYEFLSNSEDTDLYVGLMSTMKTDLREMNDSIKRYEGMVESLTSVFKTNRAKYDVLKTSKVTTDYVLSMDNEFKKFSTISNLVSGIDVDLQALDRDSKQLEHTNTIIAQVDYKSIEKGLDEVASLRALMEDLRSVILEAREHKSKIDIYSNLIDAIDVKSLETLRETISSSESTIRDIKSLINSIDMELTSKDSNLVKIQLSNDALGANQDLSPQFEAISNLGNLIKNHEIEFINLQSNQDKINNLDSQYKELKSQLDEFDICPLCGSELTK